MQARQTCAKRRESGTRRNARSLSTRHRGHCNRINVYSARLGIRAHILVAGNEVDATYLIQRHRPGHVYAVELQVDLAGGIRRTVEDQVEIAGERNVDTVFDPLTGFHCQSTGSPSRRGDLDSLKSVVVVLGSNRADDAMDRAAVRGGGAEVGYVEPAPVAAHNELSILVGVEGNRRAVHHADAVVTLFPMPRIVLGDPHSIRQAQVLVGRILGYNGQAPVVGRVYSQFSCMRLIQDFGPLSVAHAPDAGIAGSITGRINGVGVDRIYKYIVPLWTS